MIIDCDECTMNGTNVCDDCVVQALVGDIGILALADEEKRAIDVMSSVGLISPIRLVERGDRSASSGT
ncbi:MAG: hypothetical protein BMS9Abin17_1258 [Acidimicrobiia bacterium]|nr:MAG: hypothetical protein BMS9Abin17_1258 [Acidimicrobiia bacterium]